LAQFVIATLSVGFFDGERLVRRERRHRNNGNQEQQQQQQQQQQVYEPPRLPSEDAGRPPAACKTPNETAFPLCRSSVSASDNNSGARTMHAKYPRD
jgi:hypothetical protein